MKKTLYALASLLMLLCHAHPASGQDSENYVHCLILDKTKSMTGSGGGQNIWPDVKEYCISWVDGIKIPSTVVFFTYAKELSDPQVFEIKTESDKQKVRNALHGVVIDGRHTWIASNLAKAWDYLCRTYPKETKTKKIYLLTDGIEEEMNSSFSSVVNKYSATRGDYDHLYYVDLKGTASQEVVNTMNNCEGTSIGTGYHKFCTLKPAFKAIDLALTKEIDGAISGNKKLTQRFYVEGEEMADYSFTAKVMVDPKSVKGGTPNPKITPSKVQLKDLTKEGDAYKYNFNIDFVNNPASPCEIIVKLEGTTGTESTLDFSPSEFRIKVTVKERSYVDGNGWE
ncbi:MAG: VWA domain-containing protein [Bacteroidaceae bacterium]|nr:VWA domain-containing protein [Bacteroidaceae bacterium]